MWETRLLSTLWAAVAVHLITGLYLTLLSMLNGNAVYVSH